MRTRKGTGDVGEPGAGSFQRPPFVDFSGVFSGVWAYLHHPMGVLAGLPSPLPLGLQLGHPLDGPG